MNFKSEINESKFLLKWGARVSMCCPFNESKETWIELRRKGIIFIIFIRYPSFVTYYNNIKKRGFLEIYNRCSFTHFIPFPKKTESLTASHHEKIFSFSGLYCWFRLFSGCAKAGRYQNWSSFLKKGWWTKQKIISNKSPWAVVSYFPTGVYMKKVPTATCATGIDR